MLENIVWAASTVFLFMVLMFAIAQIKKDNSIVDIGWGIGFILIGVVLFIRTGTAAIPQIIFLAMITVWGTRLAVHIWLRSRGKSEDFRYAQWRKEWGDRAVVNAFIRVFMLQGALMLVIAAPLLVALPAAGKVGLPAYIGLSIFLLGFIFEAVGDCQLVNFKKLPENKGKIITSGLWKYTRHPNYFGETVLWWGIGFYAYGVSGNPAVFIGPALLNYLLIKISGVPMLEKKYEGRKDWEEYKKQTPAFVPFLGKK